jgi:putative PEP-CTERM system TPR-repeat lipoprotein
MLIVALLRQGERDKAIAESDRLLAQNSSHAVAYLIAGALRELIGEDETARSFYLQALELDPENMTAHQSISRIALASGDVQSAERGLRQLLHSNPGYYPAIVSLGTLLLQDRRLGELRPYVDRAISQAPDSIAPRVILARLELALSRPDETLRIVNDVSAQFPDEPELSHLKGLAILAKGDHSIAVPHLARAAGAAPENARYQYDLARAQLADSRFDEAFATARRQVRSQPRDQRIVALGIEAAAKAGAAGKARELVDYFASANPDHPSIAKFRGDVDLAFGDTASAIAHYESVAAVNWSRDIVEDLARAYSIAGDRRAPEVLTRWLDDHPDDHGIRFMLAQSLESLGLVDQAVAEYEHLLSFDALNVIGLNNLAWHYFVAGRSEALELAELAHEKAPNNGGVTDTLGWILAQQGDFARAVPLLREATQQAPDNAEIRFHLAEALAGSGQTQEAESIIEALDQSGERYRGAGPVQQLIVD